MIFKNTPIKLDSGIIKIPTLLGMGVLLIGLVAGVYLVTQNQIIKSRAVVTLTPKNINLVNLSEGSAAVYWQSDEPTAGFIKAGKTMTPQSIYRDDRDLSAPEPHKLHFVTLTNLEPTTTYYYQIYSGSVVYPNTPATFKTPAAVPALNWSPLVGTIFDVNSQPVSEALISFDLNGAQKLATITKTGGNFILPLSNLKTTDLTKTFPEEKNPYKAILNILGPVNNTQVIIYVPMKDISLPPIFLGKNIDLTATSSSELTKYDLNEDGIVNAADLSIILKNFGPLPAGPANGAGGLKNPKADLNGDGVVNQKDADLILPYLR